MTCQYVLLDRFDDISRRLLPTSKKIGTSSWQQCPCQEKRAERSPGRARDIDMDADMAENKPNTLLFDNELKNESSF